MPMQMTGGGVMPMQMAGGGAMQMPTPMAGGGMPMPMVRSHAAPAPMHIAVSMNTTYVNVSYFHQQLVPAPALRPQPPIWHAAALASITSGLDTKQIVPALKGLLAKVPPSSACATC